MTTHRVNFFQKSNADPASLGHHSLTAITLPASTIFGHGHQCNEDLISR